MSIGPDESPPKPRRPLAGMKGLAAGCCLYYTCGPMLVFVYIIACMAGGKFEEGSDEWWRAVFGAVLGGGGAGPLAAMLIGLGLGIFLYLRGIRREFPTSGPTTWLLMIYVAIVALSIGAFPILGLLILSVLFVSPAFWSYCAVVRRLAPFLSSRAPEPFPPGPEPGSSDPPGPVESTP